MWKLFSSPACPTHRTKAASPFIKIGRCLWRTAGLMTLTLHLILVEALWGCDCEKFPRPPVLPGAEHPLKTLLFKVILRNQEWIKHEGQTDMQEFTSSSDVIKANIPIAVYRKSSSAATVWVSRWRIWCLSNVWRTNKQATELKHFKYVTCGRVVCQHSFVSFLCSILDLEGDDLTFCEAKL